MKEDLDDEEDTEEEEGEPFLTASWHVTSNNNNNNNLSNLDLRNGMTSSGVTPLKQPLLLPVDAVDVDIVTKEAKARERDEKSCCRCFIFHFLFTALTVSYLLGGAWIIRYLELDHISKKEELKENEEDTIRGEIQNFIQYVKESSIPSFDDYSPYSKFSKESQYAYQPVLYASNLEERVHRLIQAVIIGVREYGLQVNDIYVPQFNPRLASVIRGHIISSNGSPVYYWRNYPDCVFFAFSLVSTTGFTSLYPEGNDTKLFCVVFTIVGIPLFWLATANLCWFLLTAVYSFYRGIKYLLCLVCCSESYDDEKDIAGPPPLFISFILVLLTMGGYVAACGALLPIWEGHMNFETASQFAMQSLTTLGIGHHLPSTESYELFAATMVILWLGMMLVVLLFQVLAGFFYKIHYCGRWMRNTKSTRVWVRGHQFTIDELLKFFGREIGAKEEHILKLSHELDTAFEVLLKERSSGVVGKPILDLCSNKSINDQIDSPTNNEQNNQTKWLSAFETMDDIAGGRKSGDYDNMNNESTMLTSVETVESHDKDRLNNGTVIHGSLQRREKRIERDPIQRYSAIYTPMMSADGATIV